jgi:hypothetical protein
VNEDGRFGFIDKTGDWAIEPRFDHAGSFSEGLACVLVDRKYGYIDKSGEFVVEPVLWAAFSFSEGMACVQYDRNNYEKIIDEYSKSGDPQVLMEVPDNIVAGYIDSSGKPVIWPRFQSAWPFSDGFARVTVEGEEWFIDVTGKAAFPADVPGLDPESYSYASFFFHDGMVRIAIDDAYGYLDTDGKLVIEPVYEEAADFSGGLACVSVAGKWGYIDRSGALLIQPQFDYAGDFYEGLAYVETGDKSGYIDGSGTWVIELSP